MIKSSSPALSSSTVVVAIRDCPDGWETVATAEDLGGSGVLHLMIIRTSTPSNIRVQSNHCFAFAETSHLSFLSFKDGRTRSPPSLAIPKPVRLAIHLAALSTRCRRTHRWAIRIYVGDTDLRSRNRLRKLRDEMTHVVGRHKRPPDVPHIDAAFAVPRFNSKLPPHSGFEPYRGLHPAMNPDLPFFN